MAFERFNPPSIAVEDSYSSADVDRIGSFVNYVEANPLLASNVLDQFTSAFELRWAMMAARTAGEFHNPASHVIRAAGVILDNGDYRNMNPDRETRSIVTGSLDQSLKLGKPVDREDVGLLLLQVFAEEALRYQETQLSRND